jgi:hypothetical protein
LRCLGRYWVCPDTWKIAEYIVDCTDDIFNTNLGFNKVAVGAELLAALSLVVARERSHHDYFDFFSFSR